MASGLRAVVWDMNGVLIDDEREQWEAFKRVLMTRGLEIPDSDFHRYCGVTERECFAAALGTEGEHPDVEACMQSRRGAYAELLAGRLPLYPGAREAIERLASRGVPQAIASGACRDEVVRVTEALGAARFGAVVAAEDVRAGKPDPEGYLLAARRLGCEPAGCLVIEDSVFGVEAALAAGMRCIAVAHTLPADRLMRAHAVYPSLQEALIQGALDG